MAWKAETPLSHTVQPIYDIMPIPEETLRSAAVYVCDQIEDPDVAYEILQMIGAIE